MRNWPVMVSPFSSKVWMWISLKRSLTNSSKHITSIPVNRWSWSVRLKRLPWSSPKIRMNLNWLLPASSLNSGMKSAAIFRLGCSKISTRLKISRNGIWPSARPFTRKSSASNVSSEVIMNKKDNQQCSGCHMWDRAGYQADNGHRHPDSKSYGNCGISGESTRFNKKCPYQPSK